MLIPKFLLVSAATIAVLVSAPTAWSGNPPGPTRVRFESGGARYLVIEALTDTLFHLEIAENRTGPSPDAGIFTTPMVAEKNYSGPKTISVQGNVVETGSSRLTVEPGSLCVRIQDLAKNLEVSRICAADLNQATKTLRIDRQALRNAYGIGNFFYDPSTADGDWAGRKWEGVGLGNVRLGFNGAAPSMSQFPVAYLLGQSDVGFGLFIDGQYRMSWDFTDGTTWTASTWGDQLRFYIITGDGLPALRRQFMGLVGRPIIPPRSTFGLWVSKFGYGSWDELKGELKTLRENKFPIDGFGLDLQWFGGTFQDPNNARMGTLTFDANHFANPAQVIRDLRENEGIRLMTIEESYVDARLPEYATLVPWKPKDMNWCYLAHNAADTCTPTLFGTLPGQGSGPMWWGFGSMIDWSSPSAGKFWHDTKRHELSKLGITSHWTDLGEPEMYNPASFYYGIPGLPGKNTHGDIHNLYAFLWHQSIFNGYQDPAHQAELAKLWNLPAGPRHYVMSRAGAPGMQRFGAGMWSGDTGRNMGTLRAHINSQMHISLAGLDYYSSDAGGFTSTFGVGIEPGHTDSELYTQWFADSAFADIPLKPHGWAYGVDETQYGPDHRGHLESNRANVRQRYELAPYIYSLAHRAYGEGEPIVPPLVYYFQKDLNTRSIGNVKMLGPSLLFAIVAGFGQTERRVYLPAGRWVNYHSNEWFDSQGAETPPIPVYRDRDGSRGLFTLPAFARAGAIIPKMHVDEATANFSGRRLDQTVRDELIVRTYADPTPSQFTLFEDDGDSVAYQQGAVRTTLLTQVLDANSETVTIQPSVGTFAGANSERDSVVELVVRDQQAVSVTLNGAPLKACSPKNQFTSAGVSDACWENSGRNLIVAHSGRMSTAAVRQFRFSLVPVAPRSSVYFVCDDGQTEPGEAMYVSGNLPELGAWDPARAVRLEAVHYPRWSGVISELPVSTQIQWKCLKRKEDGGGAPRFAFQLQSLGTAASGFSGTSWGSAK